MEARLAESGLGGAWWATQILEAAPRGMLLDQFLEYYMSKHEMRSKVYLQPHAAGLHPQGATLI